MIICNTNECTGCGACTNICPLKCISMIENEFGEIHPFVDESRCVQCKQCIKSCPNNVNLTYYEPILCYAAWLNNKNQRSKCASGGIGSIFSEFVITHKFGVVFGTSFTTDFTPFVTYAENLNELSQFQGSKYSHSYIGEDTFRDVRSFLKNDKFVIFIGTPCQIAGLKSFLGKDFDNLLCVDLICHGVSPSSYLRDEVEYLCKKHNIQKLSNVRFRGNDVIKRHWLIEKIFGIQRTNYALTLWDDDNIKFYQSCDCNYYYFSFLEGISLRENCFNCKYAKPNRISDITIGDFIGLDWKFQNDHKQNNVSSVTINTNKGLNFFTELMSSGDIDMSIFKRNYEERLKYRPSLLEPSHRHKLNSTFKSAVAECGYIVGSRRVLHRIILSNRIKHIFLLFSQLYKRIIYKCKCLLD